MAIILNGTTGTVEASWTTATRPASPVAGQMGFNTTISAMETYTGSAWVTSDLPAPGSSGNFLQSTGSAWNSATTLGIANGGTNNASLGVTAGGVVYTDGSALQNVGAGTAGYYLQSNGASAPTWTAVSTTPPTTYGAIGTYVIAGSSSYNVNGEANAINATVAGSTLSRSTDTAGFEWLNGNSTGIVDFNNSIQISLGLSGTWRGLSRGYSAGNIRAPLILWVRVS
jgi:hypothetical protein